MIAYCPHCNKEIEYNPLTDKDFVHECNSGNETLDNEDIIRLDVNNALMQGEANELWGTRAGNEGAKVMDLNSRGNKTALITTRQHSEYIKINNGKIEGEV